jgi:Flp pilus assembly CpaF family ATPase
LVRLLADLMTEAQAHYIQDAIRRRRTILIAGGSNTGNTTSVNALINLIPLRERLLVIESPGKIQARSGNVVRRLTTVGADLKGGLLFESLRDRPDRIIIGQVRGPEPRDMLEAEAT